MKHEIEIYKGQTIFYDEDSDKFVCDVTVEEKYGTKTRKSLKDIKREIDLFIKANLEFKPFKCLYCRFSSFSVGECINLRVDGTLTFNAKYGKSNIGENEWGNIYQFSPSYINLKKERDTELEKVQTKYDALIKEAELKLVPMNLDKYKSNQ